MNVLKIINLKSSNFSKTATSRCSTSVNLDSINMSFASYETTQIYSKQGPPPPLIIMHGLFGSKTNWNSLCKAFHQRTNPQRKIIAVDARNHGDSPHSKDHSYPHITEDIKNLLRQLKIEKASLLGHSMGGRAIMYFALKYPELVDKLIVGDISPYATSSMNSMFSIFESMQKVIFPSNVPMSTARSSADLQLSQDINGKGLRSFLLTNLIKKSDGSYAWRLNIPTLFNNFSQNIAVFPDMPNCEFKGPVLFVAGGVSDFIQKKDHSKILKLFPNAEFEIIEGAGHWLHSEKPNEFLKICTTFLNQKITITDTN